ncbi:MAG: hypothetical protein KIT24_12260 [Phycisphaeraceae bacterium]|nr:hypothetical protein [Phycisphaeraceae bacterium]
MSDRLAEATNVLKGFVDANNRQDGEAMKTYLCRSSLEEDGFSGPMPPELKLEIGEAEDHGDKVIIPLNISAPGDDGQMMQLDELRCIMIQEDGEWKFDLATSVAPQMEAVEAAMGQMMEQLGTAMGEAFGAIGDAISNAFGGSSSEPSDWSEASTELEDAECGMLEGLEELPDLSDAISEVMGDRTPVLVASRGMVDQVGDCDTEMLLDRLRNEFFPGFSNLLSDAANQYPVRGRLRAIRVEPVLEWMDRTVVLDGPDLVIRIDLREPEGTYTHHELSEIVPGVLAGLEEQDVFWPANLTTLPTHTFNLDPDAYRQHTAPRLMRRIVQRTGQPVALDIDWDELSYYRDLGQFAIWGLNRIIGAINCAMPELSGEPVPDGLIKTVRMRIAPSESSKRAELQDGVLNVEVAPRYGEKGCFFEHQLAQVLMGSPIRPDDDY